MQELQRFLEMTARHNLGEDLKTKIGASDIVQLSFLRVVEHFEKFRGSSSAELHAWLKTIVLNEINNTRRGFHTDKRNVKREKSFDANGSRGPGMTAADTNLTPSSEALSAERVELFHEMLEQLPPDYALVIRLRSIDQMTFKEIGERMNRSEDAVSKLWYRAMIKFEEKLKNSGNFESS